MYRINEIFYSLQGEGMRAGTANIFLRFAGCNLRCRMEEADDSPGGFDCDTEFASGRSLDLDGIAEWCAKACSLAGGPEMGDFRAGEAWKEPWIILTGGEPGLQVDEPLVAFFKERGVKLAVETNGSIALPGGLDWITVSPKVAEHAIRQPHADEVKYVRAWGQAIPRPRTIAAHKLISPAFVGGESVKENLAWCIKLCKENPEWRLSPQQHKLWSIR